jgi:hypothetical protein
MNSIKTFLESHKELHDFYNQLQDNLSDESFNVYCLMVLNDAVFFDEVRNFLEIDLPISINPIGAFIVL